MLRHQTLLSFLSVTIHSSQSTTVVSLFLNFTVTGVSTGATGYIIDANPTVTTYVLDCVEALCVNSKRAETCSFTGSTEATCCEIRGAGSDEGTERFYATVI
ncbi:hypothetical protein BJ170DRAFT_599139 [Xylariales sp. AK1849]|nr:hypothetical protein BJ170DRAFT_599139 [Xylariales sp. AK1849]